MSEEKRVEILQQINGTDTKKLHENGPAFAIQHWLNVMGMNAYCYPSDPEYVESYHQLLDVLVLCNLLPLAVQVQKDVGGNYLNNEKLLELEAKKSPNELIKMKVPIKLFHPRNEAAITGNSTVSDEENIEVQE